MMQALAIPRWMMGHDEASVPSEAALLSQAATDPAALAHLFHQHHGHIARYIRRRIGNEAIADDLTSEVFLAMVRYLPRFRFQQIPIRAWLYRIATNQVNRWVRRSRRYSSDPAPEQCMESSDHAQKEEAQRVRHALHQLPVHYQNALALHYLEELSIETVAQVLGCAVGTVKSRLSRGRELLRPLLTEQEGA